MGAFANFFKNKTVIISIAVVAVLAAVAVFVFGGDYFGVSVTAMIESEEGISPRSDFLIKLGDEVDEAALRERLELTPPVSYTVLKDANGEWRMRPDKPLAPGSELTVKVGRRSFDFKVRGELFLTSMYPVAGSQGFHVRGGIEFVFNGGDIEDDVLRAAVKIEPEISYNIQRNGERIVLLPEEYLQYETTYTVELGTSLEDENGFKLYEPVKYAFSTAKERDEDSSRAFYVSGESSGINMLADEQPTLQFYMSEKFSNVSEVAIEIYAFDRADDYRTALQEQLYDSTEKSWNDTVREGLGIVSSFSGALTDPSEGKEYYYNYNNARRVEFPEALPEGYYAVYVKIEAAGDSVTREVLMQVTDVSVFFAVTGNDLVVWINDAATGEPIEGAVAEFSGTRTAVATTDKDGLALVKNIDVRRDNEDYRQRIIFTVSDGEREFVGDGQFYEYYYDNEFPDEYMVSVYTDRNIYMTTDTINVWGVVRPWHDSKPVPNDLKLSLGWDDTDITPVTLEADGTFQLKIDIENHTANEWESLRLLSGEHVLKYASLSITDYVKPIYNPSSSADKPVFMLTESNEISATMTVKMFDGTPAPAMNLRQEAWHDNGRGYVNPVGAALNNFKTDESGNATMRWTVDDSSDTWYPQSVTYRFISDQSENENFNVYGSIYTINRDVMIKAQRDSENRSRLLVGINRVDISGIKESSDLWQTDALKGEGLSQSFTAEVRKVYYTKEATGEYYDYVNRRMRTSYKYERHDDLLSTSTFTTKDGAFIIDNLPKPTNDSTHYIVLTTKDSRGRNVSSRVYLGGIYESYYGYDDGIHRYSLTTQPKPDEISDDGGNPDIYHYWYSDEFEDNETLRFDLRNNSELVEEKTGRILSFVVQDDIIKPTVTAGNEVVVPYDEALLPNYVLTGAYFDGKHIFMLSDTYLFYSPVQRELEIEIIPQNESYAPGETVRAEVIVKNAYSGKVSPNTTVLLSVVDEAIFALYEQYTDLLADLYRDVYWPEIHKYTSYTQFMPMYGGEKGGGGGDSEAAREDFEDTALFQTFKTDEKGTATVEFALPDNITSWRLTTLALTDDNRAGNSKMNITATLPYFVMPVLNPELLAGDSLGVGLYSAGRDVASTDEVSYTVRVEGNGIDKTETVQGTVRGYASVDLGKLPKGEYSVTVQGRSGAFTDAVRLPVSVITSGIEVSRVSGFNIAGGIKVDPLRYPVSIMLYGENAKAYNIVRSNVSSNATWGRTEARLARKFIAAEYRSSGSRWYDEAALNDPLDNIDIWRPLPILPHSAPDVEVSVKAWLAAAEYFPKREGTYNLYSSTLTARGSQGTDVIGRMTASYLASALENNGDFSVDSVKDMLEGDSTLDYIDKIYLTMTLYTLDENEAAENYYSELIGKNLTELKGLSGINALYITDPAGDCNMAESTAHALMLATMMEKDDAHGLAVWLAEKRKWSMSFSSMAYYELDNGVDYEPYLLEQVYYLKNNSPAAGDDVVSYNLNGQRVTQSLNKIFGISMNREQLAAADFKTESGTVYADIYYSAEAGKDMDESRKLIPITKSFEVVGGGEMKPGAVVKVTLTPDLSGFDGDIGSTGLVINDYISAGMRYERYHEANYGLGWYLSSRQQQRVSFTAFGTGSSSQLTPIVYYVRCATPGEYIVESAYASSAKSDIWGMSDRGALTIAP